ncbi:MAG: histidine phosphatase family protein [Vulcanimicrobiaceae bacterium]
MAIVRIARHGESTWNRLARYQGRRDADLSPLGRVQAQALAGALHDAGIKRIVSSPLQRCTLTAQPLSELAGLAIGSDHRLIEIAHGSWEGRYREEIERDDPQRYRLWREHPERVAFEYGETLDDVLDRWKRFAASLDTSGDTLIVTHDVVVRLAILERSGRAPAELWQPRVVNGGYAEFEVRAGRWRLLQECVEWHLAGHATDPGSQAL